MKARHITIDCQLLQTADRNRGMGLFLYNLLKALEAEKPSDCHFSFIINKRLSSLTQGDRELLSKLGDIIETNLLTKKNTTQFAAAAEKNRQIIDGLGLSDKSESSVFFIPALFSSEIYPVYPSTGTANVLLFHDIIPYLYAEDYFPNSEGELANEYGQRWREAYRTDLFVTNSQTTADDLTVFFGIDPKRIKPIFGAAAHGGDEDVTKPKIAGLTGDFILMPSGDDYRKNNALAAQAFADLGGDTKLVVTSDFSPASKKQLKNISQDILFSGSVTPGELLWLLNNARLIFFPSMYEGLGMPVLEAVERRAVVACSDIPVFREISQDAFHFFDPNSIDSMRQVLQDLLKGNGRPIAKNNGYEEIKSRFNWSKTAERFMLAINKAEMAPPKPKLAVFCPSPTSYSAIGKYVFEVHAELSRYFDIDYYYENGQTELKPTRLNILAQATNYLPVALFPFKNNHYDKVLYHIGNSEFHAETILSALSYPANAIVHDTWLNGIYDFLDRYGYITKSRHDLEIKLDDLIKPSHSRCLSSIVLNQKAIFCHSQYSIKAVEEIDHQIPKYKLPLAIGVPAMTRSRGQLIVSFAGIISEAKGISLVKETVKLEGAKVKIFGYSVLGSGPLFESLGDNVEVLKDPNDKQFQDLLAKTDILVNYRLDYHGEASKSTLEAMRYGAVVIVRNVGWFGELPDSAVVKVDNEAELLEALSSLAHNDAKRAEIGQAAREFLAEHYSYSRYSSELAAKLKDN